MPISLTYIHTPLYRKKYYSYIYTASSNQISILYKIFALCITFLGPKS
nr:MAG TPA: hypothetical protein [Caudoviricetes sp.]